MAKKKTMTKEAYTQELADFNDYLRTERETFKIYWESSRDFKRWALFDKYGDENREILMTHMPALIAAAAEHGRPESGGGKWIYSLVAPEMMEKIFGQQMETVIEQFKGIMERERGTYYGDDDYIQSVEPFVFAYRHLNQFAELLKEAGVTQYKTSLTDHGMSAKEVKALEKWLADREAEIDAYRNPPPKEVLFEAPKKGKYPTFDDTEYTEYLDELRDKYRSPLDTLVYSGMSLSSSRFEDLAEELADFDYAEVAATLGAQKRWPPSEDVEDVYELYANLLKLIADRFAEETVPKVEELLSDRLATLNNTMMKNLHGNAFNDIRDVRSTLAWLTDKFPTMDCPALSEARTKVAQAYDPRWALMSGGPVHEKRMKEVVFTNSHSMPASIDDIPETLNPAKEAVYGHVFLEQSLENLGTMYFVMVNGERLQLSPKVIDNPHSAYHVLQLFPDPSIGRIPDLTRMFGTVLQAAADNGELLVEFSPDMTLGAAGTLKLKMTAADIKKLPARTEELVTAADANQTAAAVLPEIFAKAQKWPYKDKVLAMDKVEEAIKIGWEHNWKHEIDIKAMRVAHYRPGYEWDQEFDPGQRPIARLAYSWIGIIYEYNGETYCVEPCIQMRQYYMLGQGYGEDLNVMFWGARGFKLPPEQVKRIAK